MKKVLGIISLSILAGVTAIAATSSAFAWFFDGARVNPEEFFGSSQGAYFAYGTGTASDPYGINKPRHLYNLSWLNKMGYFEKNKGTNGVVYFEIDPQIENGILDGTNPNTHVPMAIPPIGDEEHPFYGNFNGNGKIIQNFVISADATDYGTQKPYNYTEIFDVNNPPQIVGLFGVVGQINENSTHTYDSSANEITDLGLTNLTIKTKAEESLVGIVAGYVNGTISNVAVNASSVVVDTATTSATDYSPNISDYGIIGHCTKNYSEIENPGDYYDNKDTYRTYAQIYEVNTEDLADPFNAHARGKQVGAGASIEMKTMYNNLAEIWDQCNANRDTYRAKYTTGTEIVVQSSDGSEQIIQEGGTSNEYTFLNAAETQVRDSFANNYHTYYNNSQAYDGKTTAQYSLVVEQTSGSVQNDRKYMCITGKKEVPIPGHTYTKQTYYNYNKSGYSPDNITAYYVYWQENANTYHYLTRGANGLDTTTKANATMWGFDASNHLVTVSEDHLNAYYLQCNNSGVLSVVESVPSNTWTYNASTHNYTTTVDGTTYYLGFNGSSWTTTIYINPSYYLIHSGNNYMANTGGTYLGNVNSATRPDSDQVKWYLTNDNYFTTTLNGTSYLCFDDESNKPYCNVASSNASLRLNYNPSNRTLTQTQTDDRSRTYYAYYNGNASSPWRGQRTSTTLTFDLISVESYYRDNVHCGEIYRSTESAIFIKYNSQTTTPTTAAKTQDTYFPLRRDDDNSSMVDDANTGYVVGGANYNDDKYGDIRVSAFNVSDLSASYTSGANDFSTMYTINGGANGKGTITERTINLSTGAVTGSSRSFTRFSNVKSQMIDTLKNDNPDSKIYGLHFMDATISTSHTIFAPWVKVRNKSEKDLVGDETVYSIYEDYEMPEDSIDFHFGENGIITFIAGAYYQKTSGDSSTRNNCFFSLHKIERYTSALEATAAGKKLNDIKSIKEIRYVYDNTDNNTKGEFPYVYEYKDGTFSTGTPGSVALFNTDWITNTRTLTYNGAYYFEIPAIKGEYALGSVSGGSKKGAYLMYLDLGANGNKIARTTVSEHFKVSKEIYDYPIGVGFLSSITPSVSAETILPSQINFSANPLDSANFIIKEGYTGQLTINRNNNAVTAASGTTASKEYLAGGYYPTTMTVTDGSSTIESVPKTVIEEDHKRVQLLDYGINYLILTQTIVDEVATITITDYGATIVEDQEKRRTIKQYAYDANGNPIAGKTFITPEQESSIIVYNPDDPTDPGAPYNQATQKVDIMNLYNNSNTNTIYMIRIPHDETTTIVIDAEMIRSAIDAAYHYDVAGYNVTVTVTGTTVTVTVVGTSSASYTFKINGTPLNSGSTTVSQSN